MLSDVSIAVSNTLRHLAAQSTSAPLSPKQSQQLVQLLQALEKTQQLEKALAAEMQLSALSDAELRARVDAALRPTLAEDDADESEGD